MNEFFAWMLRAILVAAVGTGIGLVVVLALLAPLFNGVTYG